MMINCVVDRKSFDAINVFNEFKAHGAPYSSIPKLKRALHKELVETNAAKCVSTMD
jgi:hypothetical protein